MNLQHFVEFGRSVIAELDGLMRGVENELVTLQRGAGPGARLLGRTQTTALRDVLGLPGSHAPWILLLRAELEATVHEAIAAAQRRQHGGTGLERDAGRPQASPGLDGVVEPLALRLKDDDEVDEDIELSRFIDQLESTAETVLRELRALTASLRADATVARDAALLHPQACAAALGRAVRQLPLAGAGRLSCMQHLAAAMLPVMSRTYASQVERLKAAGVQPARFSVVSTPVPGGRSRGPGPDAAGTPSEVVQVLGRLVAQASAEMDRAGFSRSLPPTPEALGPPVPVDGVPALTPPGTAPAAINRELGDRVMRQLLEQLGEQSRAAAPMREVFRQLCHPGQLLAASDPGLWSRHAHPWWQLLDRLLALCAVLEDGPGGNQEALARCCAPLVTRFVQAEAPDEAMCLDALAQVSDFAQALTRPAPDRPDTAPVAAEPSGAAEASARADDASQFGRLIRSQMAEQLRASRAPAIVRRFLLGPWVSVLAGTMEQQGPDAASRLQRYSELVDRMLEVVDALPTQPVELASVFDDLRIGLRDIGLPEQQVEQWLFDLTMRLADAGNRAPHDPVPEVGWRHEDLPTVPIDLHGSVQGARARRDCEAWLRSLRVGDICRVFLDARWQTLQLVALDSEEQLYTLQGRESGGTPHGLSRRALERLRSEGLATTVELGAFIAKAMDTMAARLDDLPVPDRERAGR